MDRTEAEGGRVVALGQTEGKMPELFGSTAHFSAIRDLSSSAQEASVPAAEFPPLFAPGAEQQFCPFNLTNKKAGGKEEAFNSLHTKDTFILINVISYHCF